MYDAHASTPIVTIGGAEVPVPMRQQLSRVTVELQRNTPAMAVVEFHDQDLKILDDGLLSPGKPLTVAANATSEDPALGSSEKIFQGEIVAVELDVVSDDLIRTSVRAYDKSHRLHRMRRTRTFLNQSDADVVKVLAGDHGLSPRVDATGGPRPYHCQHDQTDWEFLSQLARENGCEIAVHDRELVFRTQGRDPDARALTLTLGDDLQTLRLRVTSAEQAATSTVRGWDPRKKEVVVDQASSPTAENVPNGFAVTRIASDFGRTEDLDTAHAAVEPRHVKARANARRTHQATTMFEADGQGLGNPFLVPGGEVEIQGLGERMSGKYVVSMVRHVFREADFTTTFTINGSHDRSLLGVARPGTIRRATATPTGTVHHPVVATVTNINDPDKLGRVKVKLAWLDDQVETDWAPVVATGAGPESGFMVLPEVDDQVVVVFAHGDVRRPMVLGGLWNASDKVPDAAAVDNGKAVHQVWRSRSGHVVTLDDTGGAEQVKITTKDGTSLVMDKGSDSLITLTTGNGNCSVELDGNAQAVKVTSAKDLTLEANGNLTLKAMGKVAIEGQAGVALKSSATMDVEGAMTNVKASTMLALKGTPLQLN